MSAGVDPGGLDGVVSLLAAIQRAAASGSLIARGDAGGVLVFEEGVVSRAVRQGDVARALQHGGRDDAGEVAPQDDLRPRACDLLRDAAARGEAPVFHPRIAGSHDEPAGSSGLTAGDLILDLVKAAADPEWVRRAIGYPTAKIGPNGSPPGLLPRAALTPSEGFLLSRADGMLTLQEIVAISPLREDATLTALYGLLAAGLLAVPGLEVPSHIPSLPAPPARSEPAPAPEDVSPGASGDPHAAPATPAREASRASHVSPEAPARDVPAAGAGAAASPAPGPQPPRKRLSDLDAFLKRTTAERPSQPPPAPGTDDAAPAAAAGVPGARVTRSPAIEALREQAQARIADWRGSDLYRILGVDRTADEAAIRRAYYKIAKRFHPDRFRRPELEDLLLDVEGMFAATTEAYNTLTEEKARGEYDRVLAAASAGPRAPDADLPATARESYARARKHLEAEEYFDALRLLETSCQMDPSKPEYFFYLGVVQTKNPRWRKKAEESFLRVIQMSPSHTQAYIHLGNLYKAGGRARRATEMFEKVLQWDAENEEALAGLGRKKAEGTKEAGLLRALFKSPKT